MSECTISIVVPCFNAIGRVEDTLYALSSQTAAPDVFEIVVVDNNSADAGQLQALVAKLNQRTGNFRFLAEPKPGLCEVRRAGAKAARGNYVVYLDDDAVPLCTHVERVLAAIARQEPDVIGGSLLPFPETTIGREFDHTFAGWWSLRHYGPADRWLNEREYFLGANIGARRSIILEHGFDSREGRKGGALLGGDELWLGAARFRRWYVAGAPVFHKVTVKRMGTDYLARRMLSNLSKNSAQAGWLDIAGTFARAFYTPLKNAWFQMRFRARVAWRLVTLKLKTRKGAG
jgi:glycosyltransferase involved in cell wall biosynthesis